MLVAHGINIYYSVNEDIINRNLPFFLSVDTKRHCITHVQPIGEVRSIMLNALIKSYAYRRILTCRKPAYIG